MGESILIFLVGSGRDVCGHGLCRYHDFSCFVYSDDMIDPYIFMDLP